MSIGFVALGVIVTLIIVCMVYAICREKPIKEKLIIWGLTMMLVLAPFLSVPIGILVGISQGDGIAGAALMIIMFICLFLFGLILLLAGVFRKKSHDIGS